MRTPSWTVRGTCPTPSLSPCENMSSFHDRPEPRKLSTTRSLMGASGWCELGAIAVSQQSTTRGGAENTHVWSSPLVPWTAGSPFMPSDGWKVSDCVVLL